MSEDQKTESPVKKFFEDRLVLILIIVFLLFIWPTPFLTRWNEYKGEMQTFWRFTGTPAPWE